MKDTKCPKCGLWYEGGLGTSCPAGHWGWSDTLFAIIIILILLVLVFGGSWSVDPSANVPGGW